VTPLYTQVNLKKIADAKWVCRKAQRMPLNPLCFKGTLTTALVSVIYVVSGTWPQRVRMFGMAFGKREDDLHFSFLAQLYVSHMPTMKRHFIYCERCVQKRTLHCKKGSWFFLQCLRKEGSIKKRHTGVFRKVLLYDM
jgi:hypothetical protein